MKLDQERHREIVRLHVHKLPDPPPGTLSLYVVGYLDPIKRRSKRIVVLGRKVEGEEPPSIDLTPFHAGLQGVSRHHATIRKEEGGYVIEDMESVNGTWVNDKRLQPRYTYELKSGDLVRLGLLIFFVHFAKDWDTYLKASD
jgi:hypothetical protein